MTLERLIELGFDRSTEDKEEGTIRARCSQCVALFIQGYPTHEQGCIHTKRECWECGAIVERHQKYCEDCS